MKTIVNKLRFALLLGFMAMSVTAWSQGVPYINKMSITTQLFLEEMAGNVSFDTETPTPPIKFTNPDMMPLPKPRRPIASPDTIDGKIYIASTVRITNESDLAELESKGVIIQCKFDKGLVTTLIPVDQFEEVAAIEGVKRINVSALLQPLTNLSRQASNVDDVLTLSADAQSAGLTQIYDGSGVILGVIDDGIDYQHGAFKDKNGNSRIKGAYCYNGSSVTADWTGSGTLPTTDDSSEDHGTHTSTIAGGSSVIVSGTNVTVTDNHANATYGGMAPGADLFLAGTQLSTTYVLNAFQKMSNYADAQNKPLVVSNSWGSTWFARDGYSDVSDVLAQYFGDSHPNHICLFATGNSAGRGAESGLGGGMYVTGTSSEQNPLGTIVRSRSFLEDYGYQYYSGMLANAWTRASDATGIGINIHVINKNTGALYQSYSYTSTNNSAQNSVTLGGLNYSVYVLFDYVEGHGKHQAVIYASGYKTTSNYVFAIEVYPIGGSSSIVDIYGGDYTYLTDYTNTSGHNWVNGNDDLSTGDECMSPNVISVGSYVTRNGTNSTGDISDFSSFNVEGVGPQGNMHPWITAPGEVIISGLNHYVSSSNHGTVTVNNSSSPYGEMSGTSMACPAAAGIVALWLQACQEKGISATTSYIKEVMAETAIKDNWVTNGANASHFGNGKIDALAGLKYILGVITVNPTELTFGGSDFYAGHSESKTVTVTNNTEEALHLTIAGLNASLSGTPFTVTAITNNGNVAAGGGTVTITITYAPTVVSANDQATLTIAENVTVALTGSCVQEPEPYSASVNPVVGTLPYGTVTIGNAPTKTIIITNEGLNPFTPVVSVNAPFTASYDNSPLAHGQSRTITVTFTPTQETSYSETLTITAPESNNISFTYTLTGTGEAPYIAGTVDPTTLDFTNRVIGDIYTATVTIANTGTQVFTPVINTSNLPAQYTVTGNGEVAINGSINLTVSYAPTAVGTHNGSFTVTLGNETYTVNVYGSAVEVTSATVCDGTDSNYNLPIYGNYYNYKQINQMIYPSDLLGDIQGKTITSMKFYPTIPIDFSGGAFTVKMGTSTQTTYARTGYSRITANMTAVKTGQVAVSGENELVITFDEPFEYTGNNLVIDFEVTQTGTTTNTTTYFYGVNQNSTYRSFNSYGSSTNSYGRYTNGSRRAFLPKVTFEWQAPFTAGTVSPTALTFTDVRIGQESTQTVTVTNTGTLPFTPVIDTTNLPSEFTVTGNDAVAVGGTNDLTVTYSPTDEGPHSGSFTVTIGDVTYTVTVTGNGIIVNSTLYSNSIMVPVYTSETQNIDAIAYSVSYIDGDTDHSLPTTNGNGDVSIRVLGNQNITSYEVFRQNGGSTWASVATAPNSYANGNSTYTQTNYSDNTVTVADGATAWLTLVDNATMSSSDAYYVPVTHALSTQNQDNTYGAPRQYKSVTDLNAVVCYKEMSSGDDGYVWEENGKQYTHYKILLDIDNLVIPTSEDDPTKDYDLYKVRVWRQIDPSYLNEQVYTASNRLGYNRQERITGDFLMEELGYAEYSLSSVTNTGNGKYYLGSNEDLESFYSNWTQTGTDEVMGTFGAQKLRESAEETGVIDELPMTFIVRAYYTRTANLDQSLPAGMRAPKRDGESAADGLYYIAEYAFDFTLDADDPNIVTTVGSVFTDRQVVDVTYVNALGQQSSKPFDGVNIVVTRYSDGSITTTKVLK